MSGTGSFCTPGRVNRWREREVLKGLVAAVRAGASRVLVVRGEPGIGKTLLLEHVAETAVEFRAVRVTGMPLPEVVEDACRTGDTDLANKALALFEESVRPGSTEAGLGLLARTCLRSRAPALRGIAAPGRSPR